MHPLQTKTFRRHHQECISLQQDEDIQKAWQQSWTAGLDLLKTCLTLTAFLEWPWSKDDPWECCVKYSSWIFGQKENCNFELHMQLRVHTLSLYHLSSAASYTLAIEYTGSRQQLFQFRMRDDLYQRRRLHVHAWDEFRGYDLWKMSSDAFLDFCSRGSSAMIAAHYACE